MAAKSEITTIAAVARRLKIGRNQAYEAAARGEIPAIRVGRRWIVPTVAFDRWLNGEIATASRPKADATATRIA